MKYSEAGKKIRAIVKKYIAKLPEFGMDSMLTIQGCTYVIRDIEKAFKIKDHGQIRFRYDITRRQVQIGLPEFPDNFTIIFDKV
jgi:hypothetical protein